MLDSGMIFSENQTLTASGVVQSENVIEIPSMEDAFGNAIYPDVGNSGKLIFTVKVIEHTSAFGITVDYLTDNTENFITPTNTVLSLFIPASVEDNTKFVFTLPYGLMDKFQAVRYNHEFGDTGTIMTSYLSIDNETPTMA